MIIFFFAPQKCAEHTIEVVRTLTFINASELSGDSYPAGNKQCPLGPSRETARSLSSQGTSFDGSPAWAPVTSSRKLASRRMALESVKCERFENHRKQGTNDRSEVVVQYVIGMRPSKKSIRRAVEQVRELTAHRTTWQDITQVVDKLNRTLRGWANYFSTLVAAHRLTAASSAETRNCLAAPPAGTRCTHLRVT